MVRRLLSLVIGDVQSVHNAAYLLALSAFLSQILALVRDRLLASNFGAGAALDTYYAAFRIQDFVFFSVASLVSLTVLIPLLIEKIEKGKDETRAFLNSIFTLFTICFVPLGYLAFVFAPHILTVIFPGLSGNGFDEELLFLTRLLLLSPLILGLSNLLASITQAYKKFFLYALAPLLYNLGIIVGVSVLYPLYGFEGLGYGVILGALLHLLVQVPFIIGERLFPFLTFHVTWSDVRKVLFLSLPRSLTLSLNHIALLILAGLASLLTEGSIAVLTFSINLSSVPVSIIGVSYSVAAFPVLARHFQNNEHQEFISHVRAALKHIIFWATPALILLIVLRAQIVRVVLGAGAFSWDDTRLTAASLALLSLSVVAQSISLLFIRALYAAGETQRPLVVSMISSVATVLLGYGGLLLYSSHNAFAHFLKELLRISDVPGGEVLMLSLAISIGSLLHVGLLTLSIRHRFMKVTSDIGSTFLHSFSASCVMGVITYLLLFLLGSVFDLNTFWGIFLQGSIAGIVGIVAGSFMLYILRNREFLEIIHSLRHRISGQTNRDVVQTDTIL